MIISTILKFVYGALEFVIALFPNANSSLISYINGGVTTFRTYAASTAWIFPVNTALQLIGFVIVIELSIFTYKVTMWIASHLSLGFIKR